MEVKMKITHDKKEVVCEECNELIKPGHMRLLFGVSFALCYECIENVCELFEIWYDESKGRKPKAELDSVAQDAV
jgi:hypothetical protein